MTDEASTRFCKDCKHGRDIGRLTEVWGCKAPGIGETDPVDGGQLYRKCSVERRDLSGRCGPSGLLYESDKAEGKG